MNISSVGTSSTGIAPAVQKPGANRTDVGGRQADAPKDSVSIGGLAQALSGRAAALFGHLDSRARSTLEGLVESGAVSAEEAAKGLQYLADKAQFGAFMENSPPTAEESRQARMLEAQAPDFAAIGSNPEMMGVYESVRAKKDGLRAAYESGQIGLEEMQKGWRAASAEMKAGFDTHLRPELARVQAFAEGVFALADSTVARKVAAFNAAAEQAGRPPAGAASDAERSAAAKLHKAGFQAPLYRDAMKSYGAAARADAPEAAAAERSGNTTAAETKGFSALAHAFTNTPQQAAALDLFRKALGGGAGDAATANWFAKAL